MNTVRRHGPSPLFLTAIFCLFLIIPISFSLAYGEEATEMPILSGLITSMEQVSSEIKKVQAKLSGPESIGNEENLRKQIGELNLKRERIEKGFHQLAAGVAFKPDQKPKDQEFKWQREIKELLGPLIREVKRATAAPREIESLRSEIEQYDSELALAQTAVSNLNRVMTGAEEGTSLAAKLSTLRDRWQNRRMETQAMRNASQFKLDQKLEKKRSFSLSLQDFMRFFFKSRGRNLLTALSVFMALSFLLYKGHGVIIRISPLHSKEKSIYVRLFDLLYTITAILICLSSILAVFYLFSDWVLLSLVIVFALSICWASRLAAPRYWSQAKLILNLGPVREGEIITYRGLSYRVNSINFFTELENPELQGGRIRVPLKDISELRSRPTVNEEPWFPSRAEDWVLLSDGSHGKVRVQTPETVKIRMTGGAEKSYLTPHYLACSPMNLSSGFRLWITFNIGHNALEHIPGSGTTILEESIRNGLISRGCDRELLALSVRFKGASGSSLQLEITADFDGSTGGEYYELDRMIRSFCLEECRRNQWQIPRHQFQFHASGGTGTELLK